MYSELKSETLSLQCARLLLFSACCCCCSCKVDDITCQIFVINFIWIIIYKLAWAHVSLFSQLAYIIIFHFTLQHFNWMSVFVVRDHLTYSKSFCSAQCNGLYIKQKKSQHTHIWNSQSCDNEGMVERKFGKVTLSKLP